MERGAEKKDQIAVRKDIRRSERKRAREIEGKGKGERRREREKERKRGKKKARKSHKGNNERKGI